MPSTGNSPAPPPAGLVLVAARLDRGGVADHVRLLTAALRGAGVDARAADRDAAADAVRAAAWVGLHFVCYGWAPRGILRGRDLAELEALARGRRIAVYLHELWIGESRGEPLRHRLVGALQRRRLVALLRRLRPARLFTSTPAYRAILAADGFDATLLPIPGNLPAPAPAETDAARAWLAAQGVGPGAAIAAVFGTIHPEWDPVPALRDWLATAAVAGPRVLLAMGRHGAPGEARLARVAAGLPGLRTIVAGEQTAGRLAGLLACCDFALATSPWALIGKSGTAAACLEADLPVVVTRDDWRWRRGPTPPPAPHPRLHLWRPGAAFDWTALGGPRAGFAPRLPSVVEAWAGLARTP